MSIDISAQVNETESQNKNGMKQQNDIVSRTRAHGFAHIRPISSTDSVRACHLFTIAVHEKILSENSFSFSVLSENRFNRFIDTYYFLLLLRSISYRHRQSGDHL